ncbi:hypothetical protein [Streptomyces nanshensis]|uniref:Uncharacterized protein n=1 Tax=Streptomyces nanshensis TaxID=518642 RepID=A0A1E7L563_9ACTN|nr:hypothetical protein [Streptomyces nanshensis]OEV11346.1 hypothetical protein AN218_13440 [Streptomyces nanshensis]
MKWDALSKDDQQRAKEIRDDLQAAGIATTLSQVATNFAECERWAAGHLDLLGLVLTASWDASGMHPIYLRANDLNWRVALPLTQFEAAWETARNVGTDTPGDHGDHITLSIRTKSGDLLARNYPVIKVRLRRGKTVRQILLGARTEEQRGLTTVLIPVGGPLIRHLAPCAWCATNSGTILRKDTAGNRGFVCEDDEKHAAFTRRPFPASW